MSGHVLTGLAAIEALCGALNRDLFHGRLPQVKVYWHQDERYAATIGPETGVLLLNEDMARASRRRLVATLVHELGHCATKNEPQDHGIRWRNAMYRRGLCPDSGRIAHGGPLDQWLRERGW